MVTRSVSVILPKASAVSSSACNFSSGPSPAIVSRSEWQKAVSLERKAAAQLERAGTAGTENVRRPDGRYAKSASAVGQIVAVPTEIRDVKDVEAFPEEGQLHPFGAQPEDPGYAQILRIEAARERKVRGHGKRRDDPRGGGFSGPGLVELVHQLHQLALPLAVIELVVT